MPVASVGLSNLAKDLWNKVSSTSPSDIDALSDAVDQTTRNTGMPQIMAAGMVLNPKNVQKLGKLVKYLKGDKALSNVEKAIYYMKTKYPKLSGIPDKIAMERLLGNQGEFRADENVVAINTPMRSIEDAVEALAHELVHARQEQKKKLPNLLNIPYETMSEAEYKALPFEAEAFKGMETAKATYKRLMELMGGL